MKATLTLSLFCLLFLNAACQKYTADNLPVTLIHFGEGGGFTGAVKEYCILKNGQIFERKNFAQNFTDYKKVKKRASKKCFKACKKMDFEKINLDNPGDRYFFISYQTEEIDHRITWGRNKEEVPEAVRELYASLKSLVMEKKK